MADLEIGCSAGYGMVGAGYASVGTINGIRDQDYHFGVAPQALLALRLIFGDKLRSISRRANTS
jgi:hypothetical protein